MRAALSSLVLLGLAALTLMRTVLTLLMRVGEGPGGGEEGDEKAALCP